jgi:transcriptional regulator with GAF, ATPase, and Fis domain
MKQANFEKSQNPDSGTLKAGPPETESTARTIPVADHATDYDKFSAELFDLIVRHFCLDRAVCLKALMEQFEKELIVHVLDETHWNQRRTARILGVKYTTLNYKILKLGLNSPGIDHEPWSLHAILSEDQGSQQKG